MAKRKLPPALKARADAKKACKGKSGSDFLKCEVSYLGQRGSSARGKVRAPKRK